MVIQPLTPPQDITWTRLAYSRDMIDKNFGDLQFPPKWRSSLAVYHYIVPEEETADAYPNSRIVYLRLTCSITGWNPNEELRNTKWEPGETVVPDQVQKLGWDVIISDGWASKYWPCYGAIMQIGVYPPMNSSVGIDDYPEIMDFEPKKREIYETVTESGEVLSASAKNHYSTKGTTTVENMELNGIKFGVPKFLDIVGLEGKLGGSTTYVENNQTDTLRERRETNSHSTTFSQMYQLFNGYHLATNRAVFVVAPRPHTGSNKSEQIEFNLVDGQRKLEGIQDVFLVVKLPKTLPGFCVNASIDTGHIVMQTNSQQQRTSARVIIDEGGYNDPFDEFPDDFGDFVIDLEPDIPLGGGGGGSGSGGTDVEVSQLVVTRRMIQSCGIFDDNGNFHITNPAGPDHNRTHVAFEGLVAAPRYNGIMSRSVRTNMVENKVEIANQMNLFQRSVIKAMISGFSAGNYKPRDFVKTRTFWWQAKRAFQKLDLPMSKLVELGYVGEEEERSLKRMKILKVGDIFRNNMGQSSDPDIQKLRRKILDKVRIRSNNHG